MANRLLITGSLVSVFFVVVLLFASVAVEANEAFKVVGLYSETTAGSVSYRVDEGDWKKVGLGDELPAEAEVRIDVARDWVELIAVGNPNAVYELFGDKNGVVQVKLRDLLEDEARIVNFPDAQGEFDAEFANKLVVKEYLGRQHYIEEDGRRTEIKYGMVLEEGRTVNIIGINNTLLLIFPNGEETTVVGPIRFKVEDLLKGKNLYKYLNVQ
ncbi:MAG: hypothetical protein GX971_03375 [Firmicutes bacterium]|nr:hypothetical protein [Bacillota bacterium]